MSSCLSWMRGALVAAAGLVLSGCALFATSPEQGPEQRVMGLLEHSGGNSWQLQPCSGREALVVEDGAGLEELFAELAQPGQSAIFVDVSGRLVGQGVLQVSQVWRMQSVGRGCADQAGAIARWVALGDDPLWQAELGEQGMRLNTREWVPVIDEQLPGVALNFRTLRGEAAELWIYPQGCRAIPGSFFHQRAVLEHDGQRQEGCAYRGW